MHATNCAVQTQDRAPTDFAACSKHTMCVFLIHACTAQHAHQLQAHRPPADSCSAPCTPTCVPTQADLALACRVPAAAVGAALVQGAPAHAAPQPLPSIPPGSSGADLLARLTTPGDITQPGPAAPWDPKQLYYPRWLFGEWEVSSTFTGFRAPLGPGAVDPALLAAAQAPPEQGGLGSRYAFRLRFYSTLPDTFDNQVGQAQGRGGVEGGGAGRGNAVTGMSY